MTQQTKERDTTAVVEPSWAQCPSEWQVPQAASVVVPGDFVSMGREAWATGGLGQAYDYGQDEADFVLAWQTRQAAEEQTRAQAVMEAARPLGALIGERLYRQAD